MNKKLLVKTLRFLGPRQRTEKEVRDFLKKYKAKDEESQEIVDDLYKNNFLSDEEFAASWVRSRSMFKPKGIRALKIELAQKGVKQDVINSLEMPDEKSLAMDLVLKKIGRYRNLPRSDVYRKLGGFLIRRGFNFDTVKKCIDEALKKHV